MDKVDIRGWVGDAKGTLQNGGDVIQICEVLYG